MKGTYILVLQLDQTLTQLQIGRLGSFAFAPGFYLYVGSAFGSGGLAARLKHHANPHKPRLHWHIDYLRAQAHLRAAWTLTGTGRMEHAWCRALASVSGVTMPVPGFGASDSPCSTHLFALATAPHPTLLAEVIFGSLDPTQSAHVQLDIHLFD
ncbi:GIY-YIG nuclease family protein [Candidatus Chloroploca sp. M-50]|uniref:GIY-YIG nuclease family protein n=1 Tax=Candidatus Chloroploca mongolica TaxID=2528176 RepID=A0ABS4D747_9CHLR|nr:GIY-YIG nuclease family protein [Candidatus Chloroploca mongolica]MBP1465245.1 GIY-YIG nuclease family protein [Candidatus Chloroploca mongolica]